MEQEQIQDLPEMWAVVELFGHQRVAGKLTTQTLGAACLLRVDIPECTRAIERYNYATHNYDRTEEISPAYTRFFGVGAIYAINPCSEQTARALVKNMGAAPVQQYELERVRSLLAAPVQEVKDPRWAGEASRDDEAEEVIEGECSE